MVKYSNFERYFHGLLVVKPFLSNHKIYGNSRSNCNNKSSNHSLPFKKIISYQMRKSSTTKLKSSSRSTSLLLVHSPYEFV